MNKNNRSEKAQEIYNLQEKMQKDFFEIFPLGWFIHNANDNIMTSGSIKIGMIGSGYDMPNNILENDDMYNTFMITPHSKGFTIEHRISGFKVKPPRGSHYAMVNAEGFKRLRKYSGSADKLQEKFKKYIKELKEIVKQNKGNTYHELNDKLFD